MKRSKKKRTVKYYDLEANKLAEAYNKFRKTEEWKQWLGN